jgi:flagellum-specific peptidoglycan hydrolase FlgJ
MGRKCWYRIRFVKFVTSFKNYRNILNNNQNKLIMKSLILALSLCVGFVLKAETYSTQDYIQIWHQTAVEQMLEYEIPASITLAQGILESGNGNSRLAKEAKNHFGIKCHNTWNGATFIQDDDTKNECFRAYNSADESYRDHSLFLKGRKRYAALFDLRITDYKGWAKGLKSAGYATNPKYAHLLIEIIEKYDLHRFDKYTDVPNRNEKEELTLKATHKPEVKVNHQHHQSNTDEVTYEITKTNHQTLKNHNGVSYIVAKKGDTFYKISKEFNLAINQLYNYNEFNKKDVLSEGDIVYITPKRGRAKKGNTIYVCNSDMSLREVAHKEGLKLKKVLKLNLSETPDKKLPKGTKVILR